MIRHLCVSSRPFTPSCGPVRPSETLWIGPPAAHDLPCISRLAAPCPAPMSCLESCAFERFRPSQRRAMDISRRDPADLDVVNASFQPAGAAAFRPSGSLSFSTVLYTSGRTKDYRRQATDYRCGSPAGPGPAILFIRVVPCLSCLSILAVPQWTARHADSVSTPHVVRETPGDPGIAQLPRGFPSFPGPRGREKNFGKTHFC